MPAEQHEPQPDWLDLYPLRPRPGRSLDTHRGHAGPPALRIVEANQPIKDRRTKQKVIIRRTYIYLSALVRDHFLALGAERVTLLVWPPDELCATAIEKIMVKACSAPHGWSYDRRVGKISATVLAGRIRPGITIPLQPHGLEWVGDVPKEARLQ